MDEKIIKTQYRIDKDAEELAIYNKYQELIQQDGAMASAVDDYLMKKYNKFSRATIWSIRKRVKRRLQNQ